MTRALSIVVVVAALGPAARVGLAQPVADHLKCYKVRSPEARTKYTADLDGLTPESGCLIKVPAELTCVPTTKTRVSPIPPGGGPSGVPNGFNCYRVKCPKTKLPVIQNKDQFGARELTPLSASLLCAPFELPTTSTTTTTSSTTSTTAPTCSAGTLACGRPCGASCNGTCMGPGTAQFCTGIHCGSFDQVCVDTSVPPLGACSFDSGCPAGFACVAPTPPTCASGPGGPGTCFPICPE